MQTARCPSARISCDLGSKSFRTFLQLTILLILPHIIHAAPKPLNGSYTFEYDERTQGGYHFPCGSLYLTFKPGTNKLLLAAEGPAFPPATQVWRLDPVAAAAGQYTVRAVAQRSSAPSYLAYSRQCTKNEPFLGKGPSASVGVRWTKDLVPVDRACTGRYQLARFAVFTNTSCAVPATAARQRSLRLRRGPASEPGNWIGWRAQQYALYPPVLKGDITDGPDWETERGQNALGGFGASVAIHGNTIVAGGTPRVYMFTKGRSGAWLRRPLPPPPKGKGETGSYFSVSLSADLVAVGVSWPYYRPESEPKQPGRALLYQVANPAAGAVEVPRPRGSAIEFGGSAQVSDTFLAVGDGKKVFIWALTSGTPKKLATAAPGATLAGASFLLWGSTVAVEVVNDTLVYEYDRSTKKWARTAKINLVGGKALHNGALVFARSGIVLDTLDGPITNQSYVKMSVFQRSPAGNWDLVQEIEDGWESGRDDYVKFSAPALDGETLVIGSTTFTSMEGRTGVFANHRIFIYAKTGPGGRWARAAGIERMDISSLLGDGAKAVFGDVIACGATVLIQDDVPERDQGAVYLYSRKKEI